LQQLNSRLKQISDADNVQGVLFIFRGFQTGLATLQNFRLSILRLQEAGKKVIVYTPYLDAKHYYAAAVADHIIVPPGTQFEVLGLHADIIFLKDALQQIGVQMDVVQISPYKTAFDMLQHSDMTPEYRDQLDWLLDDQFDMITADMATGRSISQKQMKALIDEAPFFAQTAEEKGLIDDVAYEDELSYLLANSVIQSKKKANEEVDEDVSVQVSEAGTNSARFEESEDRPKALLKTWPQSRKMLTEKYHKRTRQFIGVVSLEGMIVMGPSRRSPFDVPIPFVGGAAAGEQSLSELLRKAEQLDDMAALIFHVDSGGGSALASELISRQIQRISEKKPVLIYMGNVAASGGYFVSANSQFIMSQRATLTGSIGVIMARADSHVLYEKVNVKRVTLQRGKRATLYSDLSPMSSEERQIFWDSISHTYKDFKQVVATGRGLPYEELDSICEGRVWTGRQAQEHKLVDGHGDFVDAIQKAASLANLKFDDISQIKVLNLAGKKDGYVLPQPYETVKEISRLFSHEWMNELTGRPLMLMPISIDFD
jgi:protease-4